MTTLSWQKAAIPIAALYACRMLGLFLLIPVFTLFAPSLKGATPVLIGVALGTYGLAQALFQIPFGMLSDKLGRKPIIAVGLIMLLIGSLLGAITHSIYGMIIARSLQGAGAIGSVLLALLSDLTLASDRAKSMAVIGATIGISFTSAFIFSPLLTASYGLSAIFYFTTALAALGCILLYAVPTQVRTSTHLSKAALKQSLLSPTLFRLNGGILIQHACLTSSFYILPIRLKSLIGPAVTTHFYLPVIVGSFFLMLPLLLWSEKKDRAQKVILPSVILFTLTQAAMGIFLGSALLLTGFCFLYFVAFNLLEALLPAQISKEAPAQSRGTVMGLYSTYQFLGIFTGGMLAGVLDAHFGVSAIFVANTGMGIVWIVLSTICHPRAGGDPSLK